MLLLAPLGLLMAVRAAPIDSLAAAASAASSSPSSAAVLPVEVQSLDASAAAPSPSSDMTVMTTTTSRIVSAPYKVVYIDARDVNWSDGTVTIKAAADAGYNVIIIAFYLVSGPFDLALVWQGVSQANQIATMNYVHSKGAIVMVSAGGATDVPYSLTAAQYATNAANFVLANNLDGLDFDMENFGVGLTYTGFTSQQMVTWLATASNTARTILGTNRYISHAPQAPYFGIIGNTDNAQWVGTVGGYSAVYAAAPSIDFFNVQYYNQGTECYGTYTGIFVTSSSGGCGFPYTSVKEINQAGIPLNKIVMGKYLLTSDASNGWLSGPAIGALVAQAQSSLGWSGGVMCWEWLGTSSPAWIAAIPFSGSTTTAPTSAPTTTPTTRPTTAPTSTPTTRPTSAPTSAPTTTPTTTPTTAPTTRPTTSPTSAPSSRYASAPYKVVYIDYRDVDWTDPTVTVKAAADAGYNVIILAFYLTTGPADMCVAWAGVSQANQIAAMAYVHAKGAIVMASAGGSTDSPYMSSAATYATNAANWVVANNLDGLDFDLENFGVGLTYGSLSSAQVVTWMATATNTARSVLGASRYISHAPQAPYFGAIGSTNAAQWVGPAGGYSALYAAAPTIDFFSVQYYNQGSSCYTTYTTLFVSSNSGNACPAFPGTAVAEIASYGIPLSKIVVGKYLLVADASNGWVSAAAIGTMVATAQASLGWTGGVMCWAWEAATSPAWIAAIPFSGSTTSAPTTRPTSAPTTTPTIVPTIAPTTTPTVTPTPTVAPTTTPKPDCTPTKYTIKSGDTMNKIAAAAGLTLAQLVAANTNIKNVNVIFIGQVILVPVPACVKKHRAGDNETDSDSTGTIVIIGGEGDMPAEKVELKASAAAATSAPTLLVPAMVLALAAGFMALVQ